MAKRILFCNDGKLATCNVLNLHEKPVQSGLSLTPRDVKSLTERGLAVSTGAIGQVDDPNSSNDGYLEPAFMRGSDMNTCWEISRVAQRGLLTIQKNDKRKFG